MQNTLDIAIAQLNFLVGDVESNTQLVIDTAINVREQLQADIVVFSELSLTGYPLEDLLFRRSILRRIDQSIEKIKKEVTDIYVLLGSPTQERGSLFNSALLIYNSEVIATYHKQHLPNYEVFDEKRYFTEGNNACVTKIKDVEVGFTICEDIWFPEPIQKCASAGAELVLNINASPYCIDKTLDRIDVLRTRVAEQNLPIIYVNQIGGQDELVFDGESLCMNKQNELCLHAPAFKQGVYTVQFSKEKNDLLQSDCMHASLSRLNSIYHAILLGVEDYVQKNHFEGVILGLSGGIDSALTLAVAVDALGADRVHAIMMPFHYTANISVEDARQMAEKLGVQYDEVPIDAAYEVITASLTPMFTDLPEDVTEENIQSRIRSLFLMAVSNKTGYMLLTTGNKSEMSVGYATLYGDMAGGFAPLKDVSKTLVYELAQYRNEFGEVIPERVITRAPSAELSPDQVDQDSLPPYEILDPILEKFIEQDLSIDQIVADGYDREVVEGVANMVLRNEYKRRQAPPGVKITKRAFGKDRRYPITSGFLSKKY